MKTAMHHPFGGEASVLYLSVIEQIEKQQPHLTVADVYSVLRLLSAEAEVQLSMDMARRLATSNVEVTGAARLYRGASVWTAGLGYTYKSLGVKKRFWLPQLTK